MANYAFLFLFSKDAFLLVFLGILLVTMLWEAWRTLKDRNLKFRDKLPKIYASNRTRLLLGVVVVLLLWAGIGISRQKLEDWNLISRDSLVKIYAKNWTKGEYKTCYSFLKAQNPPELICDFPHGSEDKGKVFKVRLLGIGRIKGPEGDELSYWNCRKNGENEPMFSCEWQPRPK